MTIRQATPEDIQDIGALIVGLAEYEHLEHEVVWTIDRLHDALFGPSPQAHVLMAIEDEAPTSASSPAVSSPGVPSPGVSSPGVEPAAGFALWYPTFSTFLGRGGIWLEDLYVRPEHRGKGFGLALLQTLRTMTDGRVEWSVLDWNEPSIAFYQALGAAPVDGWTRYRWLPGDRGEPR